MKNKNLFYNKIIDPETNIKYKIKSKMGLKLLKKYLRYYNINNNFNLKCPGYIILDINSPTWTNNLYNYFIMLYKKYLKNGIKKDIKYDLNCCPFIFFRSKLLKNNKIKLIFSILMDNYFNSSTKWDDLKTEDTIILNKNVIIKTNSLYNNSTINTIKKSTSSDCTSKTYTVNYLSYHNVFVKNAGNNLSEYIFKLGIGSISYTDFTVLFKYLIEKMKYTKGYTLNNHNMDVSLLHFKYTT